MTEKGDNKIYSFITMQDFHNDLWGKILSEIQVEVSSANFLTLFKGTALLSFDSGVATVSAPSSMIIDLLQKRFFSLIKKTVDKHTGIDSKIIFVPKAAIQNASFDSKSAPLFEYEKKKLQIGHLPRVRSDYTFQNLAVSSTNQLAYVSAMAVAKKVGRAYNPLFIYGPVGVGKTHIMQAIANDLYFRDPSKKIVYITSEEFTNEVVEAIRTNDTARMKRRFRNLDLLLIDDVQFVAGKDRVQEELFHTFNILVDASSQIVLSSDRPPEDLKKVEKRLLSRFSGGLTVDIETPDFELRTAILLIKAKKYDFDLDIETAKTIASKASDARELEGILLRLVTESASTGTPPSRELISKVLGNEVAKKSLRTHPEDIISGACVFYNIKVTALKSAKRDARLVRARQVCMYLLKKELSLTYSEIGNILGGRDHTTIMHGVEKIESLLPTSNLSEDISGITKLTNHSFVD